MAGSRAADAREPGQIREEAALSDTVRAPRTSLAGVERRRARPGTCFDGGCTVHYTPMAGERNLETMRVLAERWNSGDVEGVLDLYDEDIVIQTSPSWPEQMTLHGKESFRAFVQDWRDLWDSSQLETYEMATGEDTVVVRGAWHSK